MKTLKKTLVLLGAFILIAALASCSNDGGPKTEMSFIVTNDSDTIIESIALVPSDWYSDTEKWIYLLTDDDTPLETWDKQELTAMFPESKLEGEWTISVKGEVEEGVGMGRQTTIGALSIEGGANYIYGFNISVEGETYKIEVVYAIDNDEDDEYDEEEAVG